MSSGIDVVRELIALQGSTSGLSIAERRRRYDDAEAAFASDGPPPGERVDAGGRPAEWVISPESATQPVLVYLHGGGYALGSPRSHRHLAAAIGRAAGAAVVAPDYRLAPEHPFPAARDDAVGAARWAGRDGAPVILVGDSAGGGLVVASLLALRDAGEPLPAAGVCLSPWADLTCDTGTHATVASRDPLLETLELKKMAGWYLGCTDPRDPGASPAYGNLRGLPPLLLQAGGDEVLLDDARALARAARAAGVDVTLEEWPDMIHVWHWYFPVLDEARRAIAVIGKFIRDVVAKRRTRPTAHAVPASIVQEAHLLVSEHSEGRGFLNWVYQLNGRLDPESLAVAVDDVVRDHEILRTRFARIDGRLHQVVAPFAPGVLERVDLTGGVKVQAIAAAVADADRRYATLSPEREPQLHAVLYAVERKTHVLAMFLAEALVDSDSGSLVAAEIARAYTVRVGAPDVPPSAVGPGSFLDYVAAHPPDPRMLDLAREHWTRQARAVPPLAGWPTTVPLGTPSVTAFTIPASDWQGVCARAQAARTTPYVLLLTSLQLALAELVDVRHFLVHGILADRSDPETERMIGNFQTIVRIEARTEPGDAPADVVARTTAAVRESVAHCALPAPLADAQAGVLLPSTGPLPPVRLYLFDNHAGPALPGVRRRRFRLHGPSCAPLRFNASRDADGEVDIVLSSTTAPQELLESLTGLVSRHLGLAPAS